MSNATPTTVEVEVLKPAKPVIVPKLKSGDDAAAAKKLLKLYSDAQVGMRKIVALGLAAWEIKEKLLDHGEFGPWLAANAPSLSRLDASTAKPKASSALSNYMDLTKGVLESVGLKSIKSYLEEMAKFPHAGICMGGGLLLLPDKKIPVEAKALRDKICQLVDGKTQRQLFLEFKQADEDDDGNVKPKRGQLKGSKGLTKEMREKHAAKEEAARIEELEETMKENTDWLYDISDAAAMVGVSDKVKDKLAEAAETWLGFHKRTRAAQKGEGK